ncbi:hypothetical protein WDU94_011404 [Cyamophila willieti]
MAKELSSSNFLDTIKKSIKPFNQQNILYYYAPIYGATNYALLSVNVMHPSLMYRIIPKHDVANVFLFTSVVGSGLYIHGRKHLQGAPQQLQIMFSAYGSLLFSFGSVLIWAMMRKFLSHNKFLAIIAGLSSSATFILIGKEYLDYIDARCGNTLKKI